MKIINVIGFIVGVASIVLMVVWFSWKLIIIFFMWTYGENLQNYNDKE